jgi:hypothetical protein
MNVSEILITVSLTVAGSVAIAYTTLHLQAKSRRKTLFRALQNEVKLNLSLAQLIKSGEVEALGGCPELHTDAYNNVRLAGELSSLKENVREGLQYIYEIIIMLNRDISLNGGLSGAGSMRLGGIIQRLESLENKLAKEVQKPTKRSATEQQCKDVLQRYIMSQVPLFFTFGLLSIYAYYLPKLGTDANMSRLDCVHVVGQALLRPVGIASIAWAIVLSVVGLNCKMRRPLKGVREKIRGFMEKEDEPIFYVMIFYATSLTVLGVSFATTWADLSRTGIGVLPLGIVYGIGLAFILVLFVDNILRAWYRRAQKAKTKNDGKIPDHGA